MKYKLMPLAGIIIMGLGGCHHQDPDPCQGQEFNPSAPREISFQESTGTPTADTAISGRSITFVAPGKLHRPYSSFEWKIAGDARTFFGDRVSVFFKETEQGVYPIRLIARWQPVTACFPTDDGVDTLVKTLYIRPYRDLPKAPIFGKYQGANQDAPADTFTVSIFQAPHPGSGEIYTYMRNLSKGCQSPYFDARPCWRGVSFDFGGNGSGCLSEYGRGYLETRNRIRIEYSASANDHTSQRVNRVFVGQRVQ